jgi:GrpB-like predicted nucleotidyltransferase (UPF0157 family)
VPSSEIFALAPDTERARAAADVLFASVSAELRALLPLSADIRHIGATAIPGCLTKGDLDIVVRVHGPDFAAAEQALASRFERNTGSARTATFAAFEDNHITPHLGVQLAAIGSEDDCFHLFADRLRKNAALVQAYNHLKRSWDGKAMDDYRRAKDEFIADVLRR